MITMWFYANRTLSKTAINATIILELPSLPNCNTNTCLV